VDPATITAAGTFIVTVGGAIGGVVAFFLRRSDVSRKENDTQVIALLTQELEKKDRQIVRLNEVVEARERDGMTWWGQLKALGVEPVPANWTQLPKDDDD